jgi:hypothetical protein
MRTHKRYNTNQTIKMSLNVKPLKEIITHASDCSNMYTNWKMMESQAVRQERIPRVKPHESRQESSKTIMTGKRTG